MIGKYTSAAIAFTLTLVSAGLAQLHPAFGADWDTQDQQMQMDMPGTADQGIPTYHAYALKPPFPATLDPAVDDHVVGGTARSAHETPLRD